MHNVTCPIDGEPCHPKCIRRFIDRPEGGCMLSVLLESCNAALIVGVDRADLEEDEEENEP